MIAPRFSGFISVVLLGVTLLLAAEGEQLEPKQTVTIRYKNGSKVTGILDRVSGLSVSVRLRAGASPTRIEADKIEAIETRDKVFVYNTEKSEWEVGTPPKPKADTGTPSKKPATKNKEKSPPVTSLPALQTVEAEGVGTTVEEARKDAMREAVRKAVGAMVAGSTTVKDDKLIEDKILVYSDGVIAPDGYREIETKKDGDLFRVKISAIVVSRKLADKLSGAGFKVHEIDGKGLAASVTSRMDARKSGTAMIQAALEKLPAVIVAKASKPNTTDYNEDKQELMLNVSIEVDPARYNAELKQVFEVLNRTSLSQSSFNFAATQEITNRNLVLRRMQSAARSPKSKELAKKSGKEPINYTSALTTFSMVKGSEAFLSLPLPQGTRRGWYLWLLTASNPDWTVTGWRVYLVDTERDEVLKPLLGKPTLVVTLRNSEGKIITTRDIPIANQVNSRTGDPFAGWLVAREVSTKTISRRTKGTSAIPVVPAINVAVAPLYLLPGRVYSPRQTFRVPIDLSLEQLRNLHDLRCEVVFR